MQGQYQPYAPPPPGYPGPPRRDRANLVPVFILIGILGIAVLGALTFVAVKLSKDDGDGPARRTVTAITQRAVTPAFAGTWSGSGYYHNRNGDKRDFTATVTLTEGAVTGTSSYTGFSCSGTLTVESATSDKIVFYERITQGHEPGGNCSNAATGYVSLLRRSDGSVLYSWFSSRTKMLANDTSSQASLSRQQTGT